MECKECQEGYVYEPIGEHFVTPEMAMDGGMPEIAGMSMGVEWDWVECECCQGDWQDCKRCKELSDE